MATTTPQQPHTPARKTVPLLVDIREILADETLARLVGAAPTEPAPSIPSTIGPPDSLETLLGRFNLLALNAALTPAAGVRAT